MIGHRRRHPRDLFRASTASDKQRFQREENSEGPTGCVLELKRPGRQYLRVYDCPPATQTPWTGPRTSHAEPPQKPEKTSIAANNVASNPGN